MTDCKLIKQYWSCIEGKSTHAVAHFHTDTHFTHITLMGWAKYHGNQAPPLGVWGVFKWSVGNVVFREAQKAGECLWELI